MIKESPRSRETEHNASVHAIIEFIINREPLPLIDIDFVVTTWVSFSQQMVSKVPLVQASSETSF